MKPFKLSILFYKKVINLNTFLDVIKIKSNLSDLDVWDLISLSSDYYKLEKKILSTKIRKQMAWDGGYHDDQLNDLDILIKSQPEINNTKNEQIYGRMTDIFLNKTNLSFRSQTEKYVYNGTLLPKINDNFKLLANFKFGLFSHSLIYSKKNKIYLHIICTLANPFYEDTLDPSDGYKDRIYKIYNKRISNFKLFQKILREEKRSGWNVLLGVREGNLLANVELNMSIKDLFKEKNKVDRNDKLPIFRIDKMKEKTEK